LRLKCDSTGRYGRLELRYKNQDSRYKKPFEFRMAFLCFIKLACHSERSEESSVICIAFMRSRIPASGIAALSVTFFWPSKESNQRKLSAAPASLKGCA